MTGAFGPNSNAHGPNESLDFPYAKKIAMVMALIVGRSSAHYNSLNKWLLSKIIVNIWSFIRIELRKRQT